MKKTCNIILIILAILTVIFTVTCMWLFYLYQSIPDTLVDKFYTTIVGELLVMGIIKVFKTKYKENGNDNRTDDDFSESFSNNTGLDIHDGD